MKPDLQEVITGGAQLIRSEAVKSIQTGPKSGKTYELYNPRRTHVASAPGEAPASDTGNLVNQIRVNLKSQDIVTVESRASYSKFLEYGTSKMQARPFLFPAYKMSQNKIVMATFNRVKAFIQKVSK
jgi:HK97 gp10 family phage protein